MEKNTEYYLTVFGLKEDEMIFGPKINSTCDIDFLLYYYIIDKKALDDSNLKNYEEKQLNYEIASPGSVNIKVPSLETVNEKRKVNKIVQNAEPGEDVAELCRKKGGVNTFTPFLFFFLFLIIMFLSYVRIMPFYRTSKYWSANSDNLANCKRMGRNVYENLGETVKNGELEELICEIIIGTDKKHYNFFLSK